MSNYLKIKNYDIANGDGIGVSIFFSGCDKEPKCKGCFNSEAWPFEVGKKFNQDTIEYILELLNNSHINHLSILGGEPLADKNELDVLTLVKKVKEHFPNKKIWLWTWRSFESLLISQYNMKIVGIDEFNHPEIIESRSPHEILKYIDVLVDGPFIEEEKDLKLKWKGSKNQRVIDVKKSLEKNKIELFEF